MQAKNTSKPRTPQEWKDSGVLNEFQIEELTKVAQNPILLEALEKVLCYEIKTQGVFKNNLPFDAGNNFILDYIKAIGGSKDNKWLGEEIRALFWGVQYLEEGLKNIKAFGQPEKDSNSSENPAI